MAACALACTALAACTGQPPAPGPAAAGSPSSRPAAGTPTGSPGPPAQVPQTATLVYSRAGTGPALLTPVVAGQVVSVRFTCTGASKATSLRSGGGGLIMRTNGCLLGEIFGASFRRSARLDPSRITVTVDPGTRWEIQLWQGRYVEHASATPTAVSLAL